MTKDYNYDLAQSRIQREQMMAALAQQMAFGPAMSGQATSPLHILAGMLSAYAANKRFDRADKLRQEYSVNINAGHQRDMMEFDRIKNTEGLEAAMSAVGASTNPYTRESLQEYRKALAKGTVTNKDLVSLANPRDVLANPNNPGGWGAKNKIMTAGGVAFDENTLNPVKLNIPPEANAPIQIGPDLYKTNYTTGGLSQLNKAPRINTAVYNVNKGETQFEKTFGADQAKKFSEALEARPRMVEGVESIDAALGLLDKGIHSGIYGNVAKNLEKFGAPFAKAPPEKAANTEQFLSHVGDVVLPRLKDFGGSDTVEEMKYLQQILAGNVTLEPQALKAILLKSRKKMARRVGEIDKAAEHYKTQGYPMIPTMSEGTHTKLPDVNAGTPQNPMSFDDYKKKFLGD